MYIVSLILGILMVVIAIAFYRISRKEGKPISNPIKIILSIIGLVGMSIIFLSFILLYQVFTNKVSLPLN